MEEGMVTKARDTKTLPWSWKKGTLLEKFLICAIGLMIIIVTSATVVSRAQSLQKLIEDKNLPKSKVSKQPTQF